MTVENCLQETGAFATLTGIRILFTFTVVVSIFPTA